MIKYVISKFTNYTFDPIPAIVIMFPNQKSTVGIFSVLIFCFISWTNCLPQRSSKDNFKPYAYTGKSNDGFHDWHYAKTGALEVREDGFGVNFLEGKAQGNYRGFDMSGAPASGKAEVSMLTGRFGNEDSTNLEAKFVTAGVELGGGAIGRAALFDHTIHTGPVDINYGVTADTGLIVDKGLEAKFLGVGGYIKASGVQICVVVCFGINWG